MDNIKGSESKKKYLTFNITDEGFEMVDGEWQEKVCNEVCDIFNSYLLRENAQARSMFLRIISKQILEAYQQGFSDGEEKPMGVSQWKEHGEKYGYSDFWRKQV